MFIDPDSMASPQSDPHSDGTLSTEATAALVQGDWFPQIAPGVAARTLDLLRGWRRETRRAELAHSRATDVLSRRHFAVGGVATVLGATVSAGAFATLQGDRAPLGVRLGAAVIAAAAAGLIALQTYLNYGGRAEANRRASRAYDGLGHEMDQLLSGSLSALSSARLDRIRREFARAADAAPNVGPSAWRWAERELAIEEQCHGSTDASAARTPTVLARNCWPHRRSAPGT